MARPSARATAAAAGYGYSWKPLKIGASGWVTGLDISSDGSMRLARTDVGGAYRWDVASDQWVQLVRASSMPDPDRHTGGSYGVFEITSAPSRTSRIYLAWRDAMFVSDDAGASWSRRSNGLPPTLQFDANDETRLFSDKIAVSPTNPDVALFGTPTDGLFRTTDGGAAWAKVTSVPNGLADSRAALSPGITAIEFDPSNASIVWATSHRNGTFRSTDGGASFSIVAGGPGGVRSAAVGSDGAYVAVQDDGAARAVWRHVGGSWARIAPGAGWPATVAIDPRDPARIAVMDDGSAGSNLLQSSDGGASFTASTWTDLVNPGNDIGHLRDAYSPGQSLWPSQLQFDPTGKDRLVLAMGFGVVQTTAPAATTTVVWIANGRGIEELVAKDVVATPAGALITAGMDRGIFVHPDPDAFPDHQRPTTRFNSAWDLDYSAFDPDYVVANIGDMRPCCYNDGLTIQSGYSTDGGTTWTRFPTVPTNPATSYTWGFGNIAVGAPGNVVWIPTGGGKSPYYTKDGGRTWGQITFPGADPNNTLLDYNWFLDRKILAADRAQPGTFYVYHAGDAGGGSAGFFRSVDGGATWSMVHAGQFDTWSAWNGQLEAVPGRAGHLFWTDGPLDPLDAAAGPFRRSTDGGATWSTVPGVVEVSKFGFGAPAEAGGYPAIFVAGYVNDQFGLYRSDDDATTWVRIGDFALDSLDQVTTLAGDPRVWGRIYVGFGGSGFAYGTPTGATPAPPTTGTPTTSAVPTTPAVTQPRPTVPVTPTLPAPATTAPTTPVPTPAATTTPTSPTSATPAASAPPEAGAGPVVPPSVLVRPVVAPMPATAGTDLVVANPPDGRCAASGVYVALFDVADPTGWALVSSSWAPTSNGAWRAVLHGPTTSGQQLVVRTFCGGTTQLDVDLLVAPAAPPAPAPPAPAPSPSDGPLPAAGVDNPVIAGTTVTVRNPPGLPCHGEGAYVGVFDTTDPSTWSLLTSSWVVPAPDGSWQTTFVAPASIPYHYVTVRTFCGWLPQAQTALVVRPLPLEPPGATGAILVTPLVSPMPAPAGSLVSVSNPAGQPCGASGVFVALFDTTNPDVWSLASSAWAPTVEGNWLGPLTIPSTAGDHYVVRTFCDGTTQHDVPLTVVG